MGEIILTLLLAALAVAAVSFMAFTIYETLIVSANIQESPVYNCLNLQTTYETLAITDVCYNLDSEEVELEVKRSSLDDVAIDSLRVAFYSDVPESVWGCSDSCSDCSVPEKGKIKTYYISDDDASSFKKAELYFEECELDEREIRVC
ncbi:hypothetical protein HY450_00780 [Candidatus Pacearchaeota archaeon]|nr:hypothetical protein [Candidatus Pacearchaeota archaeon]